MLAKKYRLTRKEVVRLNQRGKRLRQDALGIKFFSNRMDYSRFAINIPKSVLKKSVQRSRTRRRIYEHLSLYINKDKFDVLITLFKETPMENIKDQLNIILKKIYD